MSITAPPPVEVVDNPVVTSWSEIDAFRQCPFKHHLAYRERWQSDADKPALARGTAWHEIMEAHYEGIRNGTDPWGVIGTLLNIHGEQTEQQELLMWMYMGYCELYGKDKDPGWTIKEIEWKGFAPLPNPHGGPSRFMLKVKIDLIAAKRGRLWIWDHKTARNLPSDKELDLDDQFGLYIWCMRQLGYPVAGAIYNTARTQRNKKPMEMNERFSRVPLSRTDVELDTLAAEAYLSAEKAWVEVQDVLPERTPNTDTCRWKCDFTEACLTGRKGGNAEAMLTAHGYTSNPFREVELDWKRYKNSEPI